jgi:hypothetical protein
LTHSVTLRDESLRALGGPDGWPCESIFPQTTCRRATAYGSGATTSQSRPHSITPGVIPDRGTFRAEASGEVAGEFALLDIEAGLLYLRGGLDKIGSSHPAIVGIRGLSCLVGSRGSSSGWIPGAGVCSEQSQGRPLRAQDQSHSGELRFSRVDVGSTWLDLGFHP